MVRMDYIKHFCKDCKYIVIGTKQLSCLDQLTLNININNDEISRSLESKDYWFFTFNLGMQRNLPINLQHDYMQTIELFYPNVLSWRFDGKNIEAIAKIPITKNNLGVLRRYRTIYQFIRMLRGRLSDILKYREFIGFNINNNVSGILLATGTINNKTGTYVVDINPLSSVMTILIKSRNRDITNQSIKELNMRFWVKEINPDFFKEIPQHNTQKKYPLTPEVFNKYPPCIKDMTKLRRKGNRVRYLLATFFLHIHNGTDAKHQLLTMLNDDERGHMTEGDCKGQWNAITVKKYPPPNCKTLVEEGFCPRDCKRPRPIDLEV